MLAMKTVSYQFKFTGDPWVDAGVIGLWDYIEDKEGIASKFGVVLERNNYSLSAPSSKEIEGLLQEVFERIKNNDYIQSSRNKTCIYNKAKDDFEIINKINLVNIVNSLFSIGAGASKPDYEKCQLPKDKYQEWEKLREQHKGVDFKTNDKGLVYCSPPRCKWPFFKPNLAPQKQDICAFCGSANASSDIHSNNYPFLVPVGNWSNFYSNLSLELKMCSLCEIASLFAVNKAFFNINWRKKRLFIAIPHASSLPEIKEFWDDVKGIDKIRKLKILTKTSNIFEEDEGYRYSYLNEATLAFAYKLYIALKEATEVNRLLESASTKTWHFFLGDTSGKSISFGNYILLDDMHRLFRLFSEVEERRVSFSGMFSSLSIKEGKDYSNLYRESLSEKIIKNASINEIAERIMWKKGKEIEDTENLKEKDRKIRRMGDFAKFVRIYNLFKEAEYVG